MAPQRKKPTAGAMITALVSPVRQEIVDTIEALGGQAAAADIAAHLGRPADGLYYHLRQLVANGVLRETGDAARGRLYRTNSPGGRRVRLRYGRGTDADTGAMAELAGGLLRTAERDFVRALRSGTARGTGAARDLWISRVKGWVDAADLREINRLLNRLSELLHQPRSEQRDRLVSLAWTLAPIDDRPLRRTPRE